jgi:hypothetical protein
VSGNPGGRPKKRPISDRYHEFAEQVLEERTRIALGLPKGATNGDALTIQQFRAGFKSNTPAAREIREAIEGKATQRLEIVGEDGGAVKVDIGESLARIREFYGLANPGAATEADKSAATVSVPEALDRGQEPAKDRGKK